MYYYLSNKQLKQLEDKLFKDKEAIWRMSSDIANTEASAEKNRLIDDYLEDYKEKHPKKFEEIYVRIDFKGEEAQAEVSTLINTYRYACPWFKVGSKSISSQIIDDYEGRSINYPFGEIIYMQVEVEKHHSLKSLLFPSKGTKVAKVSIPLVIKSVNKVTGIIGDYFEVQSRDMVFMFDYSEGISIRFK